MTDSTNNIDPPINVKISETTENYLKRILILSENRGVASISDIAQTMGRSRSSASEAVKRMAQEGYLNYEKYGKITLTDKGRKIAESVHDNYETINSLLQLMGIPQEIAMLDACSMEHSISDTTISTITNFITFFNKNPQGLNAIKSFREQKS